MTLACPQCGSDDLIVRDSRPHGRHNWRRRRVCAFCNTRFTTYEVPEEEMARLVGLESKLERLRGVIKELHDMV